MEKQNRVTDQKVSDFIRSIIYKSGISQEKWAESLDVSPRMIAYYCSGQRMPSVQRFWMILEKSGKI